MDLEYVQNYKLRSPTLCCTCFGRESLTRCSISGQEFSMSRRRLCFIFSLMKAPTSPPFKPCLFLNSVVKPGTDTYCSNCGWSLNQVSLKAIISNSGKLLTVRRNSLKVDAKACVLRCIILKCEVLLRRGWASSDGLDNAASRVNSVTSSSISASGHLQSRHYAFIAQLVTDHWFPVHTFPVKASDSINIYNALLIAWIGRTRSHEVSKVF